jgi:hypothetical protein
MKEENQQQQQQLLNKDGPPLLIRCKEEPLNIVDETLIRFQMEEEEQQQQLKVESDMMMISPFKAPPMVLPASVSTAGGAEEEEEEEEETGVARKPSSTIKSNNHKRDAPTADEVIEFLVRQYEQKKPPPSSSLLPSPPVPLPPPVPTKTKSFLPESTFINEKEKERNVKYDLKTNRCYVYTTDMSDHGLSEFLFLNVPNDSTLTSICGWHISNRFGNELLDEIKQSVSSSSTTSSELQKQKKRRNSIGSGGSTRRIFQDRNLSIYKVDVRVPFKTDKDNDKKEGDKKPSASPPTTDDRGEMITLEFRIRFYHPRGKLHKMLSSNFMNCHLCIHGIMVLIPCMSYQNSRNYWGSIDQDLIKDLPTSNVYISPSKLDTYCNKIAKYHGTYRGEIPMHCVALLAGKHQINQSSLLFDGNDTVSSTSASTSASTATASVKSKTSKRKSKKRKLSK